MRLRLLLFIWALGLSLAFFWGKRVQISEHIGNAPTKSSRISSVFPSKTREAPRQSLNTGRWLDQITTLEGSEEFQNLFSEHLPSFQNHQVHEDLFLLSDEWAARFPKDAVAWLNELQFNDPRNPFLFSALTQWGQQSPQEALVWLKKTYPENNATRNYLQVALIRGLSHSNPQEALALVLDLPTGPNRLGSIEFILNAWSQKGLDHAFQQVSNFPKEEIKLKQRAIQRLIADLPKEQLTTAKTWLEQLSDPTELQTAIISLAANWAHHDLEGALEWSEELTNPLHQARSLGEITTRWARKDPEGALKWLEEKPASAHYDYALRGAAGTLINREPERVLKQVSRIVNPLIKEQTFEQVGRIWLSSDPQGFLAAMQKENPIPDRIRQNLLQSFR